MLVNLAWLTALFVLNGLFAMSEIAVVSSRRARLVELADRGHPGAARALALASEPTRFLSTVQMGITAIGILSGAIGEAAIATRLRVVFEQVPALAASAQGASVALMVISLTYVSLILGELVPKRLALTQPEIIASRIARPMEVLSLVAQPLVHVLSLSTEAILRLLRVRKVQGPAVTLEEFKVLVAQGAREGVFEKTEEELVTNVLNLDERSVGAILTPRSAIRYLDVTEPFDRTRERLAHGLHSVLPVCEGGLDHVVGVVRSTDILQRLVQEQPIALRAFASRPLFVPRTMSLMTLLEQFRRMHLPLALVVDDSGDVDGLVTLTDVMSAIVGDRPEAAGAEPTVVQREDGSWLIDGAIDMDTVRRVLKAESLGKTDQDQYHTLGGFASFALGRVPQTGDVFERGGFRFEIADMDANRVDRVLVTEIRRE
jgi:putative hemolysin